MRYIFFVIFSERGNQNECKKADITCYSCPYIDAWFCYLCNTGMGGVDKLSLESCFFTADRKHSQRSNLRKRYLCGGGKQRDNTYLSQRNGQLGEP